MIVLFFILVKFIYGDTQILSVGRMTVQTLRQQLAIRAHRFPSPHRRPGMPPRCPCSSLALSCICPALLVLSCSSSLPECGMHCCLLQQYSRDSSLCILLIMGTCFHNT